MPDFGHSDTPTGLFAMCFGWQDRSQIDDPKLNFGRAESLLCILPLRRRERQLLVFFFFEIKAKEVQSAIMPDNSQGNARAKGPLVRLE